MNMKIRRLFFEGMGKVRRLAFIGTAGLFFMAGTPDLEAKSFQLYYSQSHPWFGGGNLSGDWIDFQVRIHSNKQTANRLFHLKFSPRWWEQYWIKTGANGEIIAQGSYPTNAKLDPNYERSFYFGRGSWWEPAKETFDPVVEDYTYNTETPYPKIHQTTKVSITRKVFFHFREFWTGLPVTRGNRPQIRYDITWDVYLYPRQDNTGGGDDGGGNGDGPDPQSPPQQIPNVPPSDDSGGGGGGRCSTGMAVSWLDGFNAKVRLSDTPLSYPMPRGPKVSATIQYNEVEKPVAAANFSNFGPNWTLNWLTYVNSIPLRSTASDPAAGPMGALSPAADYLGASRAIRLTPGGYWEYYDSFQDENTGGYFVGNFAPNPRTRAVLRREGNSSNVGVYKLTFSDGTVHTYGKQVATGTTMTYFLTKVIDPQENEANLFYDSQNRLIRIEDEDERETTFAYELENDPYKITSIEDPFERTATFEYDNRGRLIKSIDPMGIVSEYGYEGDTAKIAYLKTPYGKTTFRREETASLTAVEATDPLGQTQRVELRENAPSIAATDTVVPTDFTNENTGLATWNSYYWDKKAFAEGTGDYAKATVTHWAMGENGLTRVVRGSKRALENRVWYKYPGQTNPRIMTEEIMPLPSKAARKLEDGSTQAGTAEYNNKGYPLKTVDALGRTTVYIYHTNGIDLQEVWNRTGTRNDRLLRIPSYDKHRPVQVIGPDGRTTETERITEYEYNSCGQVRFITNALGQVTEYDYDTDGYLETVTPPTVGGHTPTVTYGYDAVGRVETLTDSEGYTVTMTYDDLDRPKRTTYPDSTYEEITYDKLDAVQQRDRLGRITTTTYDELRRVIATKDPEGRMTKYTWCSCGSLGSLTDANGNKTEWEVDLQGRTTKKIFPDDSEFAYFYDATGRLEATIDARDQQTIYAYNADDTLDSVTYPTQAGVPATGGISYEYHSDYRRVEEMTDATGTTEFTYYDVGELGALKVETETKTGATGFASYAMTHVYDELGRKEECEIDGEAETAQFDAIGRVTDVTNPLGTFDYHYVNATGRLDYLDYPNGQKVDYDYYSGTADPRLKQIKNLNSSNAVISQFDYEYNAVGNVTRWTQKQGSEDQRDYDFEYDLVDQLTAGELRTAVTGLPTEQGFKYDLAGNRVNKQEDSTGLGFAYNNLNQLTKMGPGAATHLEGTVTREAQVTINGRNVPVNGSNVFKADLLLAPGTREVEVKATDEYKTKTKKYEIEVTGSGSSVDFGYDDVGNMTDDGAGRTYTYDALNRVTKITHSGVGLTEFYYDGLSRRVKIIEKDSSNTVLSHRRFVWCGTKICVEKDSSDAVVKRFYGQGVKVVGASSPNDKLFYARDHLGTIRELVDDDEVVRGRWDYDLWGKRSVNLITSSALDSDFGYTGHLQLASQSLHWLTMYRLYRVDLGRWLSRDPLENAEMSQGPSLYGYVANDPINFIDPFGLEAACTPWYKKTIRSWTQNEDENYTSTRTVLNSWSLETPYGGIKIARSRYHFEWDVVTYFIAEWDMVKDCEDPCRGSKWQERSGSGRDKIEQGRFRRKLDRIQFEPGGIIIPGPPKTPSIDIDFTRK
jgi:RHS repeat-associated protein